MNQVEQNYIKSIELVGAQIKQAYQESKKVRLPKAYSQVNQIVVCGMGGSQLGVDIIRHLFGQSVKCSLTQVRGYHLPKFVDSKTLVFLLSYSGNTEETLEASKSAVKAKSKIVVITSGGKLAAMAKRKRWPLYQFEPVNNPSGQPRMGTGYMMGAVLAFLKRLRLIDVGDGQIVKLTKIKNLKLKTKDFGVKLKNKIPVIVSSEFLQGNAHVIANQINESSKQLALYYSIPELNHHLLEGLTFPKENKKILYFLFFYSKNYHSRNQRRYKVTQQILTKQKIPYTQLEFMGDKISQAMQMLTFGSYLSYELAKVNKVDPNKIPWVNFLKKRLRG